MMFEKPLGAKNRRKLSRTGCQLVGESLREKDPVWGSRFE